MHQKTFKSRTTFPLRIHFCNGMFTKLLLCLKMFTQDPFYMNYSQLHHKFFTKKTFCYLKNRLHQKKLQGKGLFAPKYLKYQTWWKKRVSSRIGHDGIWWTSIHGFRFERSLRCVIFMDLSRTMQAAGLISRGKLRSFCSSPPAKSKLNLCFPLLGAS